MATVTDVKDSKALCDAVYQELSGMKKKILELRARSAGENREKAIIGMFERHLGELADEIDWKIQILSHSCPYDWEGSSDFENDVQVDSTEKSGDAEFSPGYVGG
jgi:hypothetical protein